MDMNYSSFTKFQFKLYLSYFVTMNPEEGENERLGKLKNMEHRE